MATEHNRDEQSHDIVVGVDATVLVLHVHHHLKIRSDKMKTRASRTVEAQYSIKQQLPCDRSVTSVLCLPNAQALKIMQCMLTGSRLRARVYKSATNANCNTRRGPFSDYEVHLILTLAAPQASKAELETHDASRSMIDNLSSPRPCAGCQSPRCASSVPCG